MPCPISSFSGLARIFAMDLWKNAHGFPHMYPLAQHSALTQWHLARHPFVCKFCEEWSAHAPYLFEFCPGDRRNWLIFRNSQPPRDLFCVHPEITHGTPLCSISCHFTSISDSTGTPQCMHAHRFACKACTKTRETDIWLSIHGKSTERCSPILPRPSSVGSIAVCARW